MLDFRKVFYTFAAAALVVGTAYGQATIPTITGDTGTNAVYVAAEGMTESLPSLVFQVTNGTSIPGGINFTINLSVPFTNGTPTGKVAPVIDATATDNSGDMTGVVTQTGPTTVQVTFSSVTAPLTSITISGLRANASASVSPSISFTVGTVAGSGIQVANGVTFQPIAYLEKTLGATTVVGSANEALAGTSSKNSYPVVDATLNGGFPGAFKTAADITNGGAIMASQGTRLAVTFNNLNANVNYYVPATVGTAPLVLTAFAGATGNTAASTVTVPNGGMDATITANTWVALPTPVNGSSTIYYGVTTDAGMANGAAAIWLYENIPSQTDVTVVSSTPVSVSTVVVGASSGYPEYSSTQTANTGSVTIPFGSNGGLLTLSTTTLVFPYVSNAGGFDTGLVIANATAGLDPNSGMYSKTAVGQPGTFTIYFFGANAPSAPYSSSGAVTPGTVGTPFLLSSIAPGFDGYIVVTANFSNAHGFALVTNGTISQGYLAVVTNTGGATSTNPTF